MASYEELNTFNNDNIIGNEENNKQWKAEEAGDYIVGKYLRTEAGAGKGSNLQFHILETDNETHEETSVLNTSVLKSLFDKIEPGTVIKIVFDGWKTSEKTNQRYKSFKMIKAD